jgi:quinol-cytochrome oxidoreductase complex cytochrome b subunit
MHLFRGLYYTSYAQPREVVWLLGVVILLLMIITRFIGYVLPWGLFLAQNDIEGAVVVGMAWAKPSPCQPSCSVF